jgi:hypothetical protein
VNRFDGGCEFFDRHAFEKISTSTCFEGAEDIFVAIEGCEDDESSGAVVLADTLDGFDAGESGQLQIHEGDVGLEIAMEPKSLGSAGGLAHNFHLRHDAEQSNQTLPNDVMVIDDENANPFRHGAFHLSDWLREL